MNKNILKLKILSASLCLSATILTGCGNNKVECYGSSSVNYENEELSGKIKYEDLNNYVKIVKLEQNGIIKNVLLMKEENERYYRTSVTSGRYDEVSYKDLKTGTTIIEYIYYPDNEKTTWKVGENLNIIEEQDITGYLLEADFIKKEYDINEVITFYEEKILPTLNSNEKEMIK